MDRLQKAVALAEEKLRARGDSVGLGGVNDIEYKDTKVVSVGSERLAENRVVAGFGDSIDRETFRLMRTKVFAKMRANNWRTVAVSTPTLGQGKSTVVANLAVSASMEVTQSVLAVDLDLERPNLHKIFDLHVKKGLSDVIQGRDEVQDVLVNPGIDRLTIAPGGKPLENSSEWLSNPKVQALLEEFRTRYRSRFVIYDMPPILRSDGVLKSIKDFDCSLLVVEDGVNLVDEIKQSIEVMSQTNFLGYVLNKAPGARAAGQNSNT